MEHYYGKCFWWFFWNETFNDNIAKGNIVEMYIEHKYIIVRYLNIE